MILLRLAVSLAIVAMFAAAPKPRAAAEASVGKVELRIEVFAFGAFHVLTNRTTIEASADHYAITTELDTRGIASLFIDLNSRSEVHGRLSGNAVDPVAYRSDVERNGVDRRYRIDYDAAGPVASEWAPPAAGWRSPIPTEKLRGTVDQLTAYFIVERQLAERGSCNLTVPVFDGHSRYNLRFRDAAAAKTTAFGPGNMPVPSHVCTVTRDDVGGIGGSNDPSEGTYQKGRVWYAQFGPGNRMVPVRIEYDTEFGLVTGHLAEFRGSDGTRSFAQ